MATLTGQTIASSYEQLLSLPDGGGNGTTLVDITDGDGVTTFSLKLAQYHAEIRGTTGTGATGAGKLNLSTAELTVVDNDVLGKIDFLAPLESSGTDAILAGASIWGEAEATFAADNNSTALVFATNTSAAATERMRISSAGNVGIGIGSPDGTTHIHTASSGSVDARTDADDLVVENSAHGGISILTPDDQFSNLMFGSPSDSRGAVLDYSHSTKVLNIGSDVASGQVVFKVASSTEAMRIDASGNVGIGTASPDRKVHIMTSDASLASADANVSLLVEENDHTYIELLTPSNKNSGIIFSRGTTAGLINYDHNTNAMTFGTNDGATDVTISSTGHIGIGNSALETWKTDMSVIQLGGDASFAAKTTAAAGNDFFISRNAYWDKISGGNNRWEYMSTNGDDEAERLVMANGTYSFDLTGTAGADDDPITFTSALKLNSNSRISLSNNDSGGDSGDGTGTSGNTIFGYLAGAAVASGTINNVLIGHKAGTALNAGDENVLIGSLAGDALTTGDSNTAIGRGSIGTSVAGTRMVGIGQGAIGGANTTAASIGTVSIGMDSLYNLIDGAGNTAVGYQALSAEDAGGRSTAVGHQALAAQNNDIGGNTAVGWAAGDLIVAGYANTLVGSESGTTGANDLTSGTLNTLIGQATAVSAAGATNQTVIGRGAVGQEDNSVTLGDANVTDVYLGHQGKTALARAMQMKIGESGTSFDVSSKQNSWITTGGNITTNNHYYGIIQDTNLVVQNGSAKTLAGIANTLYWNHATPFGLVNGMTNNIYIATVGSAQSGDVNGVHTTIQVTDADVDCQNIYGLKTFLNLDDGNTSTNVYGEYTEIDIEANHEAQGNVYGSYIKVVDDDASAGDAYGLYIESGAGVDASIYANGNHSGAYVAQFYNDGNNEDRYGVLIQGGADDASGTTFYLTCRDGDGGGVGYIANTSGTFALTDPSDRRLKKDIVDTSIKGLETVEKMQVRDFEWKKSGDKCTAGFIAQELKEVFAPAVQGTDGEMESYEVTPRVIGQEATYYNDDDEIPSGKKVGDIKTEAIEGKDAVLGERIVPMGVSRDVLVPVLVKAIQELSAKVTELESKL